MNGKPTVVLRLTEVAEPVTYDNILHWCDDLFEDNIDVERIVLWEHQHDYLIKQLSQKHADIAPNLANGTRIWGIPLTIRTPASNGGFIEFVHEAYAE
jgi:hypothetical protein